MPATGDNSLLFFVVLFVLIVALILMFVAFRKVRSTRHNKLKYPF